MPVRERAGVICLKDNHLLSIELQDPVTAECYWSFPGGALEPGETPEMAAIRETLEETGYQVELTSDCYTNRYEFNWGGQTYQCTTHWYLARLTSDVPSTVNDADYNLRADWLPLSDRSALFGYHHGLVDVLDHFFNATD